MSCQELHILSRNDKSLLTIDKSPSYNEKDNDTAGRDLGVRYLGKKSVSQVVSKWLSVLWYGSMAAAVLIVLGAAVANRRLEGMGLSIRGGLKIVLLLNTLGRTSITSNTGG